MREVIMGYQGEMSLKGLNRNQFESTMMKILRYRLKTVGKFRVYCTQSTFYMEPEEEDIDMDLAFERVSKVFGLAALSRAVVCEKDFDTICQTAEDYLGDSLHGIKTFKVEARRSDKTFPMTSPELMRELGAYLLGRHNSCGWTSRTLSSRSSWRSAITVRISTAPKYRARAVCLSELPAEPSICCPAASTALWRHTGWQSEASVSTTSILRPLRILLNAQN